MTEHQVIPLFPTPLYAAQLPGVTAEELEFVHRTDLYSRYQNQPGLCVGSDQFDILNMPQMRRIKTFVQQHLDQYSQTVMCVSNCLFPTISWLNRTTTNAYHYQHHHVNSLASGIFYFTPDPTPLELHVEKTCAWTCLKMFPTVHNQYNTAANLIEIKQGTLLLFPAYLQHSVPRSVSAHDRISLAFNTWTSGSMGLLDQTSYLNLDNATLINEPNLNVNYHNGLKSQ